MRHDSSAASSAHGSRSTPSPRPQRPEQVLDLVRSRGIRFLNLEFTDVVGTAKCVMIPAEELPEVLAHGKWFDGSSIENFARVAETDMYLRPDPTTYAEVPWRSALATEEDGRVARLICDVLTPTGEAFEGDPRAVLQMALEAAADQGYRYEVAPELEFFLLSERDSRPGVPGQPLPNDRGGYFDLAIGPASDVRREIVDELGRMGIGVEGAHHEVAAGQHEIDFQPGDALRIADALVTARDAIRAIAQRRGLWATFLPKPFNEVSGSGMHTHQSLMRLSDGASAFTDHADTQYGLSLTARHFIAGQLAHARGLCAVVNQLVNSYKRLATGFEAPIMVSWARLSREALVRVPRVAPGAEAKGVELRSPDPACNPYLAFAAMLRAGLDGIAQELPLPQPVEEELLMLDEPARRHRGIALLPTTLGEALDALREDEALLSALGEQISAWFLEAKAREWEEYRRHVSPWELERYLPTF